jgi:hypothetical protein
MRMRPKSLRSKVGRRAESNTSSKPPHAGLPPGREQSLHFNFIRRDYKIMRTQIRLHTGSALSLCGVMSCQTSALTPSPGLSATLPRKKNGGGRQSQRPSPALFAGEGPRSGGEGGRVSKNPPNAYHSCLEVRPSFFAFPTRHISYKPPNSNQ